MKTLFRAILAWLMRYEALLHAQVDKFELVQMRQRLEHLTWQELTLDEHQGSELEHFDIDQKIKRDNFLAQQQIERLMLQRELVSMKHRQTVLERAITNHLSRATT